MCLQKKQSNRPKVKELLKHDWITEQMKTDEGNLSNETMLEISENLTNFRKLSVL